MKRSVGKYKKQFLLNSKINNTLSFFNKKAIISKNNSNKFLYPNLTKSLFYNKSFSKTTTALNNNKRNLSFNNINNTYIIEPEKESTNLLNSLYKNSFFPKSLKNKKFIREIYNRLPFLQLKKGNSENDLNDNNKVKEVLFTEYENSINNFKEIYKNSGEELFSEIKSKEIFNESIIDFVNSNRINNEESNYISSIIKSRKKNISVEFENESFLSPKNSLMTLKINNQLINNIKESVTKYQYNSFAEKINSYYFI